MCTFMIRGSCKNGDQCVYAHDKRMVPCMYYHVVGKCTKREECEFSHEGISEERMIGLKREREFIQNKNRSVEQKGV
jgi:hypothetical protein